MNFGRSLKMIPTLRSMRLRQVIPSGDRSTEEFGTRQSPKRSLVRTAFSCLMGSATDVRYMLKQFRFFWGSKQIRKFL
jgi:hypothetical protein